MKQRNNRKEKLSASSRFLCLPLTKPELRKKNPQNFAGGHSVVLGAVNSQQLALPSLSLEAAFPFQSSPGVSVGQLHSMGVTQPELPGCACTHIPLDLFMAPVFPNESHSLLALLSQTSTKSDKRKVAFPPEGYIIYEAYRSWEITQGRSNMSYIPSYTRAVNYLQAAASFSAHRAQGCEECRTHLESWSHWGWASLSLKAHVLHQSAKSACLGSQL